MANNTITEAERRDMRHSVGFGSTNLGEHADSPEVPGPGTFWLNSIVDETAIVASRNTTERSLKGIGVEQGRKRPTA